MGTPKLGAFLDYRIEDRLILVIDSITVGGANDDRLDIDTSVYQFDGVTAYTGSYTLTIYRKSGTGQTTTDPIGDGWTIAITEELSSQSETTFDTTVNPGITYTYVGTAEIDTGGGGFPAL